MKLLHVMLLCMTSAVAQAAVSHAPFGKLPDGSTVEQYTLKSSSVELKLISYGARVISISTPDRHGKLADIALGYDSLDPYVKNTNFYFGVVPGRYANRIAKGQFTLDGKTYHLPVNNGVNSLHGGNVGFDQHNWSSKEIPDGVEFTLVSPDGDQGFPGEVTVRATYQLDAATLSLTLEARTTQPTVINLSAHPYFNLGGLGCADVLGHEVTIAADG